MRERSIRARLFLYLGLLIAVTGALTAILGHSVIRNDILKRAQRQARNDLNMAHNVLREDIESMQRAFSVSPCVDNPDAFKTQLGLDYLVIFDTGAARRSPDPMVAEALAGTPNGGTRIIDSLELITLGNDLASRARIEIVPTSMARPSSKTVLSSAMVHECAVPIRGPGGTVTHVMFGGKLMNRDLEIVDKIHDIVFEPGTYQGRPLGTATLFLDDVRIATNVLTLDGKRAIGTRVSGDVYRNVVQNGGIWLDRAFVVNDWYLSGYEPVYDINHVIVGILYVGILEKPYRDRAQSLFVIFLGIMIFSALLAVAIALLITSMIGRPLSALAKVAGEIAGGLHDQQAPTNTGVTEINRLASAFNGMVEKLGAREKSLTAVNHDLTVLNKRYLDLVGMVSHELKGILASTVLNTYSVRDGYLGPVTAEQKTALDSACRNLEYFDATIRNFLNLSRIDQNELTITPSELRLYHDLLEQAVIVFKPQAEKRGMSIQLAAPTDLKVMADPSLLAIVFNSLIGNATKYGSTGGAIRISAGPVGGRVRVEVYNDGRPLNSHECSQLFERFSRLVQAPEVKGIHGTGLGLFLCREIIDRHGGTITCEPREKGNAFIVELPVD
jgi:two-component system, NtrC family, sensor kinase